MRKNILNDMNEVFCNNFQFENSHSTNIISPIKYNRITSTSEPQVQLRRWKDSDKSNFNERLIRECTMKMK
jgi:hypothetical protein